MYSIGRALKNICRNIRLSLASVVTVSACIFLFCVFFCVLANLNNMITNVETRVGITVFFNEEMSAGEIEALGEKISERPEVKEMKFTSADEAWESFKTDYFAGREELAEGFAEDNPLKGSANYCIFLNDISKQGDFVGYLESLDGVRQVNYSGKTGSTLKMLVKGVGAISAVLILILLAVAVFIIRNTIAFSAENRKTETGIMRLIGATNSMIRAPFVIEGMTLGFIGVAAAVGVTCILYNYAVNYCTAHFAILNDILNFLPMSEIFPVMSAAALLLGVGMGFFASHATIRKHLKV